jgi:hypothetical protein
VTTAVAVGAGPNGLEALPKGKRPPGTIDIAAALSTGRRGPALPGKASGELGVLAAGQVVEQGRGPARASGAAVIAKRYRHAL